METVFQNRIDLYKLDGITSFDNVEVHGCREFKEQGYTEQCDDKDAQFWSVYVHIPDLGVMCIADCDTKELAEQLQTLLLLTAKQTFRQDVYEAKQ